jgi:hypothetical protein
MESTTSATEEIVARLSRLGRYGAACWVAAALTMACATRQGGAVSNTSEQPGDAATDSLIRIVEAATQQPNTLTSTELRQGWRLLFDGATLNGWRQYQADTLPTAWKVVNGTITKNVGTRDIVTREQFGDFELVFEWKVATGGNAGVFYRATEEYDRVYWSAPEYQLLDDPNAPDGKDPLTSAGAAYGLYAAPRGAVKPAGEWNTARIVARGAHIEHWLNGTKMADYEAGSPEWEAKVKGSKFAPWANYGRARRGHIALQGDHRGDLALRNIKIREIR